MIIETLSNHYNIDKLHNSYLINTDDIEKSFAQLNEFIQNQLLKGNIEADYICIKKIDNKVKNISVDQIRDMQKFLYKTSVISGKKIAVIYGADQMNINAANSCLKILEDTPKNTYIFLLSEHASNILPTIHSRCAKINVHHQVKQNDSVKEQYIIPLLNNTAINEKLKFIAEFASKDRDLWQEFASNIERLIVRLCKKSSGINNELSEHEQKLLAQFKIQTPGYLNDKYDQIKKIINETIVFDLDLRASSTILIDKFRN
ncbi:MAG: DNA polymerase III subunit delta' [Rickettsiales bacterium]|nr:MAG: DNA polymerase III subunit delta' [Rickettsiales bacterium]